MPDRSGTVSPADEMRATRWVRACNGAAACVEVAYDPDTGVVRVRDSKDPDGPVHVFTVPEWRAFLTGVKAGRFDLAVLASGGSGPGSPPETPLTRVGASRLPE